MKLTWRQRLRIFGIIILVMAFATLIFAISYGLTTWIFSALGLELSAFWYYLVKIVLGLILFFVSVIILGRIFGQRQQKLLMDIYNPILEALGRIGKGDFNVQLDHLEDSMRDDGGLVRKLAKSVTNVAAELNQIEQMRQEFISNVSHEIQSPLTSIRGFARALQNDDLSPETRGHYLTIIETESMRLSKLSDNLLKLTTLESEHIRFEPKAYRLDRQIRDLILLCEPQWMSKSLDMDVALDEITITADEDLLSQVWINLIHNGIKFTPEGGRICAQLCRLPDEVEFRITDSGIGISADDQAHVFERFYKADKSRERSREGSGLGLAIAHKIVTLHHGTIAVTSQPQAGTTFTVRLPLQAT